MYQYVIASVRTLNVLVEGGQIRDFEGIKQYLAYLIKTMELAPRFEWKSVLIYDDQFRQLQALYDVPWVYESHHLHTVKLVPLERVIARAPYPTARSRLGSDNRSRNFSNLAGHVSKDPSIAMYTSDGNEICCEFNSPMDVHFINASLCMFVTRVFQERPVA